MLVAMNHCEWSDTEEDKKKQQHASLTIPTVIQTKTTKKSHMQFATPMRLPIERRRMCWHKSSTVHVMHMCGVGHNQRMAEAYVCRIERIACGTLLT